VAGHDRRMDDQPADSGQDSRGPNANTHLILAITLVMLVWGVASEALREIVTGFLDEVRFD
jgi:hypothetical protein